MPKAPMKPCSYPMCPKLVEDRFCSKHMKEYNHNYEKYQRDPRTHKRYGREWKKVRKKYIRLNPLCSDCFEKGILKTAEEVHHIKPLSQGGTHDFSNLRSLCKPCHSRTSVLSGERWGERGGRGA